MKPPLTCLSILIVILCFATACSSNEIGNSKDVNPETIYMNYSVDYKEGDDSVNCFLQYRFAGSNGTTLVLSSPSKVAIDGAEINADSATLSGAYYEKKFAADNFNGQHTIAFTDINNKVREEKFSFHRINCTTQIPQVIGKEQLALTFDGAENSDVINVTISDTSAATEDIQIGNPVTSSQLIITAAQLKTLAKGPVQINIFKKQDLPLLQPTTEGGKLILSYDIKDAAVELKD